MALHTAVAARWRLYSGDSARGGGAAAWCSKAGAQLHQHSDLSSDAIEAIEGPIRRKATLFSHTRLPPSPSARLRAWGVA